MSDSEPESEISPKPPRWQALSSMERRILGVLGEKAKTTPDAYPMSLNAITTGSNQKSNRFPVMQLEAEQIEEALDRLRTLGAVGMIEGYGRVAKYRHYLYEWLGVDKVELAVMIELLLRGAQTEGELRGRASRMEPLNDLAALRHVLESLRAKRLVISLTPEGRGHVVSHNLYKERELEGLRAQFGAGRPVMSETDEADAEAVGRTQGTAGTAPPAAVGLSAAGPGLVDDLRRDISELRALLMEVQHEVEELSVRQRQTEDEIRQLRDSLGG